jgi:hypothetical protein
MLHLYEAQEMLKSQPQKTNETMGLKDQLEVKVIKGQIKSQEAKQ